MAYQLSGSRPGLTADLTRAHTDTPARPAFAIQVNALQAMCRQVFGFRLAMIAIATPYAIGHTAPGLPTWFIGSAVLVTFMGSYVLFRDWERFGPVLLRHPWLLAVDALFGSLLLITATPESTLAYVTVCTPLLAGLVQGWRGAAVFAALQVVIVFGVYASVPKLEAGGATGLLLPGFCVIAGAVGVTLRNLLLRFGTATQALTETRARLAVNEAVEGERTRLAREMHDSVAKTLHGLALAAEGLACSADRMEPSAVRHQAELVARAARRAAAESRELLTDLRREQGLEGGVDLMGELESQAADFTARHRVTATFRRLAEETAVPPVPQAVARQLLTVASEALENAHRHADPTYLVVLAGVKGDVLRVSVYDDGCGLPAGTTLEGLRRAGHFGLVGMVERAASIGARIRIGRGKAESGTEVRVELPLAALAGGAGAAGQADGPGQPPESPAEYRPGKPLWSLAEPGPDEPSWSLAEPGPGEPLWSLAEPGPDEPSWSLAEPGPGEPLWSLAEPGPDEPSWSLAEPGPGEPLWSLAEPGPDEPSWSLAEPGPGEPLWSLAEPGPDEPSWSLAEPGPGPEVPPPFTASTAPGPSPALGAVPTPRLPSP